MIPGISMLLELLLVLGEEIEKDESYRVNT